MSGAPPAGSVDEKVSEDFGADEGARLSVVSAWVFQQRGFLNLHFSEAFMSSLLGI